MENIKKQNIGEFVEAVNNNEELRKALNEAVMKALPKKYFKNLDEFVNFLPAAIKNFFDDKQNLGDLKSDWESFQIQDGDLEKLYKINLALKTKTNIIRKFDILNENNDRLSTKENIKKAIRTFKKILGRGKVSVRDFCDFVCYNIGRGVLSSGDLDGILGYVKSNDEKDKSQEWRFWLICDKFKSISSEKFINFIVENTDFTELDDEYLIGNIVVLVHKHPKYQGDKNKDNMVEALKDILCGNDPYKKFSEALANVPSIGTKIKLDNIKKIMDEGVAAFAKELGDNSIEIKFENNKFVIETTKPKKEEKIENEIDGNKENQTEVSWLKIGIRLLSAVIGISLLILSFFAPGVVLPFLTNLLPISTFTAKITLAVVGFGLAVVGGTLSVRGIINNIMYKNSPGNGPGGDRSIKMPNEPKGMLIIDNRFNPGENLSRNTINKNKNETTI